MFTRRLVASHYNLCNLNTARHMASIAKVKVKQGTVVGGERNLPNGKPYHFFKGIPYAVPPLGELRFEAPVPLERFAANEIDCRKEGNVSFQKDPFSGSIAGSEDCLFLNVYTPRHKSDEPLPVMVFIHGGGYMFGNGNGDFHTPLYLMQEGVVVITFNYRLGPLGFLSLPEGNIAGNAGLKDQRLALQWVKENVSQFGGDPNNITLFGESAGAASVHLHVISAGSKDLFHKAIMQSGTANMPWVMQENPSYKATKLAQLMGCTSEDPVEIAKFLKTRDNLIDFLQHITGVMTPDEMRRGLPLPFRPVVEHDSADPVITEEPLKSLNKPNLIDIPLMMGYNSGEGIVMVSNAVKKLKDLDKDLSRTIPRNIDLHPEDPRNRDLTNQIRNFYFKGGKVDGSSLDSLVDLFGDFQFIIDKHGAAEIHSRKQHNSPLFFYRLDYVGGLNYFKKVFQLEKLKGCCHAEDLAYLFQAKIVPEPWDARDKKFVQTICKLWANFAKYSNPTSEQGEQFVDREWEPVKKISDGEEFNLNAFIIDEKPTMLENPDQDRIGFWKSVYQSYGKISSKL